MAETLRQRLERHGRYQAKGPDGHASHDLRSTGRKAHRHCSTGREAHDHRAAHGEADGDAKAHCDRAADSDAATGSQAHGVPNAFPDDQHTSVHYGTA